MRPLHCAVPRSRGSARRVTATALLALTLACCLRAAAHACTVFFAFDGQVAIAGQNEDWDDANTQLWVVPRTATTHGVLYFGFGRGQYPKDGISFTPRTLEVLRGGAYSLDALTPDDIYGLPQQGINEKGLFFGGAQTDIVSPPDRSGRPKHDGAIVDLILRRCATVAEALQILEAPTPEAFAIFSWSGGNRRSGLVNRPIHRGSRVKAGQISCAAPTPEGRR